MGHVAGNFLDADCSTLPDAGFKWICRICQSQAFQNDIAGVRFPGVHRYYAAEGVRVHSQETWNIVTQGKGKQLVEENIERVVQSFLCCVLYENRY
jgi:hypothetical protein